jgi:hypothetical protein
MRYSVGSGLGPGCNSRSIRTCCDMAVAMPWPTRATTPVRCIGHKNIQHTVRYSELAPDRFATDRPHRAVQSGQSNLSALMNGPDFAASGAEWRVFHPSLGFHGLKGAIPVWEHWKHLRTTNVIESPFATVRHRTVRSKGCLSNKTALAMIFKLAEAAEKTWRRLNGHNQLPKIILGIKFTDGIEIVRSQAQTAAA